MPVKVLLLLHENYDSVHLEKGTGVRGRRRRVFGIHLKPRRLAIHILCGIFLIDQIDSLRLLTDRLCGLIVATLELLDRSIRRQVNTDLPHLRPHAL